ncbi:hypothetical protein MMC30_005432 [Trapelia coarctata]|nr:hypothetical protein [Trapelia coarctata]
MPLIADDEPSKLPSETGSDTVNRGSSLHTQMWQGLGACFEVMTTPRAGTLYTFISMTATVILGIVAWKLSQESLDLSMLALSQNASPATTASQAPSESLAAAARGLEIHTHGPTGHDLNEREHAINQLCIDFLYVLAIIVLFLSNYFLDFVFRGRKGPFSYIASFINFLMNPAMLVRFSRDAPRFYAFMTIFLPFVWAPILWCLLFITIARFSTTPVHRPVPAILIKLKDTAVWICRLISVALCVYSAYDFASGGGNDNGIKLLGIAIKTFMLVLAAEIQLERGDIMNRILPKEPIGHPV